MPRWVEDDEIDHDKSHDWEPEYYAENVVPPNYRWYLPAIFV